jgi:hypothetical protein
LASRFARSTSPCAIASLAIEQDHIRPLFFRERHSGRPVYGLDNP